MIRFVTPELEPVFVQKIDEFGIFATKIYSQYQTYGAQSGIVDFWIAAEDEEITGVISKLGGCLTVAAAPKINVDELSAFFEAVGGNFVDAENPLIERLRAGIGTEAESSWIMSFQQDFQRLVENSNPKIIPADRLRTVYGLLCVGNPRFSRDVPYDAWLAETSHKQRHGLTDIFLLVEDGAAVSTCSIQFKGKTKAMIASVATDPAYAKHGYGREIMRYVAGRSLQQGLTPYLLTADDALAAFYEKCGFVAIGRWGRLQLARRS